MIFIIGISQNCEAKNITENLSPVLTRSPPLVSRLTGLLTAVYSRFFHRNLITFSLFTFHFSLCNLLTF
jgi:hypothetical protein